MNIFENAIKVVLASILAIPLMIAEACLHTEFENIDIAIYIINIVIQFFK